MAKGTQARRERVIDRKRILGLLTEKVLTKTTLDLDGEGLMTCKYAVRGGDWDYSTVGSRDSTR